MVNRLTFGGLASGLDTNAIIDALLQVAQRPIALAETRKTTLESRKAALAQVATSLSKFLTQVQSLAKETTFTGRQVSVLSDTANAGKLTATASAGAAVGSFKVDVVSLATATKVSSSTAMGQAVDQNAPLDDSGYITPVTAGTFTINNTVFTIAAATATNIVSQAAIGAAVDPAVALDQAGLDIAPVSGTFTINGVGIAFDATTDSLNDIMADINASAAGVTATYDSSSRTLKLTNNDAGPQTITLADSSGNFLQAMKLIDGTGTKIGTETAGTEMPSLSSVVTDINNAAIGVTASIVDDAAGRPNLVRIASDDGVTDVTLGAGGDTSNFLSASKLLASPSGPTRTSTGGVGGIDVSADLADARFVTALSAATGTFTINGVQLTYDQNSDSLSNIITRINQSAAGVVASYDGSSDALVLTSKTQGSTAISLSDDSGNFLAATNVLGAGQTLGANASYRIDGGALQYSTSNTVTDAVAGVTLTLRDVTTASMTVEVSADTTAASKAVEQFVGQYNSTMTLVRDHTKYVEDGKNGALFGDSTLRMIDRRLRSTLVSPVTGASGDIRTLSDVGVHFGVVGSAVGSTDTLTFDAAKFNTAIKENPTAVARLFHAFTGTATLDAGGTGSIASISGTPSTATRPGKYTIDSTASGALTVTFTPDDGSSPVTTTGTITAGGTNTTLIAGVTLTATDPLVTGTNTITLSASEYGVARQIEGFVDALTRTGGILGGRNDEMQATIDDINEQIETLEARVAAREEQLIRQYSALEVTMQRLQQQQQALSGMIAQLQANRPK
jgi:flagellar hook-associated protein 2